MTAGGMGALCSKLQQQVVEPNDGRCCSVFDAAAGQVENHRDAQRPDANSQPPRVGRVKAVERSEAERALTRPALGGPGAAGAKRTSRTPPSPVLSTPTQRAYTRPQWISQLRKLCGKIDRTPDFHMPESGLGFPVRLILAPQGSKPPARTVRTGTHHATAAGAKEGKIAHSSTRRCGPRVRSRYLPPMTSDDVLDEFRAAGALREGHFVLSSGLHSGVFLQKNLVFMDGAPHRAPVRRPGRAHPRKGP